MTRTKPFRAKKARVTKTKRVVAKKPTEVRKKRVVAKKTIGLEKGKPTGASIRAKPVPGKPPPRRMRKLPEPRKLRQAPRRIPDVSIKRWFDTHVKVANAIVWQNEDTSLSPYPRWTAQEKKELYQAVYDIRQGRQTNLPETPPLAIDRWPTILTRDVAWNYFIHYVAQSLAIEFEHAVAWSLNNYDAAELELLLDSRSLFRIVVQGYGIDLHAQGDVTPGDPLRVHHFLVKNDFIRDTRIRTIERVIDWCRDHMLHSGGTAEELGAQTEQEFHWQFNGSPPVERVIAGTSRDGVFAHWVRGCWSVTGFLKTTLRTVNIPVRNEPRGGLRIHSLPSFPTENLYTTHGDDLIGTFAYPSSMFPSLELLISRARFKALFSPKLSDEKIAGNVGRRSIELALTYLPPSLLQRHCNDLDQGAGHASSSVFKVFQRYYSLAKLENENLWQRMDKKILKLGGCDAVKRISTLPVNFD